MQAEEIFVVDEDGFRTNVGIILTNNYGRLFWAKRTGKNAWQFPQGGVNASEDPQDAMFRELHEETGLLKKDVSVIRCTSGWLRYRLPKRLIRYENNPVCIGQKQKWFLLKLTGQEQNIKLDTLKPPEFDAWRWVNYWYPLNQVVNFKKEVYRKALSEFIHTWIQLQSN